MVAVGSRSRLPGGLTLRPPGRPTVTHRARSATFRTDEPRVPETWCATPASTGGWRPYGPADHGRVFVNVNVAAKSATAGRDASSTHASIHVVQRPFRR